MTTVAYRDGVIASDTRITAGDSCVGEAFKCGKLGRLLFGAAGNLITMQMFMDWVRSGATGEPPKADAEEGPVNGFAVVDDRIVCFGKGGVDHLRADFYAIGSGRDFALGAMAAGATAQEAVRAAMTLDCGSGGRVVSFSR